LFHIVIEGLRAHCSKVNRRDVLEGEMTKAGSVRADFSGKRVLLTGASRGIAAEIARSFAINGASVVINYSAAADQAAGFPGAAEALVTEMKAAGSAASAIEADLLVSGAGRRLVDRAVATLGGIDILVLSAAIATRTSLLDLDETEIAAQLQVNVIAAVQILQATIPLMRTAGWGRIITIGSVQEESPSAEMPIYALTKAGQANLVKNIAVENAPYGITVNNVSPGLVKTDRNEFRRRDMAAWDRLVANANPMGRAGLPEDISGAVLFLCSEDAAFVTGITLFAAGGAQLPFLYRDGVEAHRPRAAR
jgi:NAD(P)-dependent dehydrogenase (short-subunit alcohol dehydrogenase family)